MTEKMQAYSIEQGDYIVLKGKNYYVASIDDGTLADYRFTIWDDEGFVHSFECNMTDEIRVIVDPYVEVEA